MAHKQRQKRYVVALWDWSTGHLRLKMIAEDSFGSILPQTQATTSLHQAYRWASRQAARQWLNRQQQRMDMGEAWDVLDLRRTQAV